VRFGMIMVISIDGHVGGWFTDNTARLVLKPMDGMLIGRCLTFMIHQAIAASLEAAKAVTDKPSLLICCKTIIDLGSSRINQAVHDSMVLLLGEAEVAGQP